MPCVPGNNFGDIPESHPSPILFSDHKSKGRATMAEQKADDTNSAIERLLREIDLLDRLEREGHLVTNGPQLRRQLKATLEHLRARVMSD